MSIWRKIKDFFVKATKKVVEGTTKFIKEAVDLAEKALKSIVKKLVNMFVDLLIDYLFSFFGSGGFGGSEFDFSGFDSSDWDD